MKKWILLLLAMVMVINVAFMAIGCGEKKVEKPAAKEEAKPPETPAPAAPATTAPAPAAPAATKK